MRNILQFVLLPLLMATLLTACRAKPAPSAGFADSELMTNDPQLPFHKFWRKPDVEWANYDTLYIADVNTSFMLAMTDWQMSTESSRRFSRRSSMCSRITRRSSGS